MKREDILRDPSRSETLTTLARRSAEEMVCWSVFNDVYLIPPDAAADTWTSMSCVKLENPEGRCSARILYRGWPVEFSFLRQELPRWREFNMAVRQLLDRYVIDRGSSGGVTAAENGREEQHAMGSPTPYLTDEALFRIDIADRIRRES